MPKYIYLAMLFLGLFFKMNSPIYAQSDRQVKIEEMRKTMEKVNEIRAEERQYKAKIEQQNSQQSYKAPVQQSYKAPVDYTCKQCNGRGSMPCYNHDTNNDGYCTTCNNRGTLVCRSCYGRGRTD